MDVSILDGIMKKVYQTIFGAGDAPVRGNCLQAIIASLFDMELDEVPHFMSAENNKRKGDWKRHLTEFLKSNGYQIVDVIDNPYKMGYCEPDKLKNLADYPSIGGAYYAQVYSSTKVDLTAAMIDTHAVLIDKHCTIVHDPEPKKRKSPKYPLAAQISYNGVIRVYIIRKIA